MTYVYIYQTLIKISHFHMQSMLFLGNRKRSSYAWLSQLNFWPVEGTFISSGIYIHTYTQEKAISSLCNQAFHFTPVLHLLLKSLFKYFFLQNGPTPCSPSTLVTALFWHVYYRPVQDRHKPPLSSWISKWTILGQCCGCNIMLSGPQKRN